MFLDHTHNNIFSCTHMGVDTRIKIKFTLKYFAFGSAIMISTSFCAVSQFLFQHHSVLFCDVMPNDKVARRPSQPLF